LDKNTLELTCTYESTPEIWGSRHMQYKDRDKRGMCWQSMGEALNTSVKDVQSDNCPVRYCIYCSVWNGLL